MYPDRDVSTKIAHFIDHFIYHKNVIAGAVVMLLPSMYPAAPATMQPTAKPTMTEMFLRKGDPNSSVMMMLMKDRNPSPMNSGEPQGRGRGAAILGQSSKNPEVGRPEQSFDPPPQLGMPEEPMREAPIMTMTVPIRDKLETLVAKTGLGTDR